ncbi:hypothetical protein [Agromyces bauzanensis]
MNTTRTLGTSALVAALTLTLVGCNQASEDTTKVTTVEKERFASTEVCNAPAWIRERAPEGICETEPVVDDNMSLRRLHLEHERSAR